jgi:hypothetical protein
MAIQCLQPSSEALSPFTGTFSTRPTSPFMAEEPARGARGGGAINGTIAAAAAAGGTATADAVAVIDADGDA